MNHLITLLVLATMAIHAHSQETITQEELAKIVPHALARVADFDNLPIKVDADGDKPFGMKIKDYAAAIIPDKALTKESLAKVGKDIIPVGQLWLSKLSPAVKEATTPNAKLRLVTLNIKDVDHKLPLLLLGVRQQGENGLELIIYAKAKEPLLTLPLKLSGTTQNYPLEINMREGTTTLGVIEINILGAYQAVLPVGEQEGTGL